MSLTRDEVLSDQHALRIETRIAPSAVDVVLAVLFFPVFVVLFVTAATGHALRLFR